jgi:iron complex transport system substrate-binding protein
MTAVKRHNLFHINPDIMQRHTPRILDGTEQLCAHLDTARRHRPGK